METPSQLTLGVALIVGMITAIVSFRVLRAALGFGNPILGACIGLLTGIGLAGKGGRMSTLLIPYEALGLALVLMLLLVPLLKGKPTNGKKETPAQQGQPRSDVADDPWAKELRHKGKLAKRFGTGKKK